MNIGKAKPFSIIICRGVICALWFACSFGSTHVFGQKPVEAKVQMVNGRASIVINDRPVSPLIYSLTDVPGGRWSWEEIPKQNLQTFCKAGFRLMQVDLFLEHAWMEDGSMSMATTQRQLQGVLDACPEALIMIRFHVNAPKWWQKLHPEENTVYGDREPKPDYDRGVQRIIEDDEETPVRTSLASKKWKAEASTRLVQYLKDLASLPESNSIAAIQIAGGVYGEWHYWGFIENEPDFSNAMRDYFTDWVKAKYKSDVELKRAWSDPKASIAETSVPDLKARKETSAGIFRDPKTEQRVIDYYEAQHSCVADNIIHFCRLVKENWPRPVITGAFYGYFYSVFGREAAGGHLELQRVLKSQHVDFLAGPGTYYPDAVQSGEPYRSRSLITSIRLHGKLWLDEMDQQPPLVPLKDTTFNTSLQKSIGTVRRNVLAPTVHGGGLWFYDFGPSGFNGGKRLTDHGTWGWWDEPSIMKDIAAIKTLVDAQHAKPYKSIADVLLVHDTKSFYHTGSDRSASFMGHWTNNWIPPAIYKSGIVHDVIHIDDLSLIDPDQYKVVVFINSWVMTDEVRGLIKSRIARNGRHLVFLYAPGYSNEKALSEKFIEDVTGTKLTLLTSDSTTVVRVKEDVLPGAQMTVWKRRVSPLWGVDDPDARSLGVFQNGQVGFSRKTLKNSTSWFIALPPGNPAVWRYVFREGGANIYSDSGDVIYGGSGILAIHVNAGGERTIRFSNGVSKKMTLPPYSTTILDSETGELLLSNEN